MHSFKTPGVCSPWQDVFVSRRGTVGSDLVGHAGTHGIIQAESASRTQHSRRWWTASDAIIQSNQCVTKSGRPTIGVTPALLSSEISKGCLQEVERLHKGKFKGESWDTILMKMLKREYGGHDWTEYTLYWSWGCKSGLNLELHTVHPNLRLYGYWGFRHGAKLAVNTFDTDQIFGVLQSISGASGRQVSRDLAHHILKED
eukprot:TRINITY_DN7381_c0_g1_i11.p1 TRINITY_DN7381_c0_g1~~TRINITY_DN7381_c0_g1_i11.p1  ORF type:complete len:201 (+),score=24.37 TRINITY_DN7381_c0_g1_i11:271-873(+)